MITEIWNQFKESGIMPGYFCDYPQAKDRAAWDQLKADYKNRLITQGEHYLQYDYPVIKATDYMDFTRTGNRDRYQNKQFKRRTALNALVLAECAEHEERFMDDIINGLTCICEETAWQLPAHNSYIRDTPQLPLPDPDRPVIDLFAAETGAVLATAEYLLRKEFHDISPAISSMIDHCLKERLILPYVQEHFWWMGDGQEAVNNWTVWCTQNILLTVFTRQEPEIKTGISDLSSRVLSKACQSLDYFLAEYGEDGCCDEGAQYYHHAGLCLFNCLEVLNGITDGGFISAYREEKIKNIAAYILNVHIHDKYYVNFADCSPVAGRLNSREFLFGKRTENPELMAFAAADYQHSEDPLELQEHNLFYRLQSAFTQAEMNTYEKNPVITHPDLYYESVGLFMARDSQLFLAVKAGDNDDSHNHNDAGSFTIYKNGNPLIIDVGVESYTRKTFSPERYDIWTMQSFYHNLPTFWDGDMKIMEGAGSQYCAKAVSWTLKEDKASIVMDIAGAYPDQRIQTYQRKASLYKGKNIVIEDHYEGNLSTVVLSLMTYEEPIAEGDGCIHIGNLGICKISGGADIQTEVIPITDMRLKGAWKHDIYRCLITMENQDLKLEIE